MGIGSKYRKQNRSINSTMNSYNALFCVLHVTKFILGLGLGIYADSDGSQSDSESENDGRNSRDSESDNDSDKELKVNKYIFSH